MQSLPVNWLAVMVAAAIYLSVGRLWYSRLLFGTRWLELTSAPQERIATGAARPLIIDSVMSLIVAIILSSQIHFIRADGALGGAIVGLANWLGFSFTAHAALFVREGRPLQLVAIDSGCNLVALVVIGTLLGYWP